MAANHVMLVPSCAKVNLPLQTSTFAIHRLAGTQLTSPELYRCVGESGGLSTLIVNLPQAKLARLTYTAAMPNDYVETNGA